ncbi:MAG: hypothetical protein ABJH63_05830 [Rhizobiaceae bacterium]
MHIVSHLDDNAVAAYGQYSLHKRHELKVRKMDYASLVGSNLAMSRNELDWPLFNNEPIQEQERYGWFRKLRQLTARICTGRLFWLAHFRGWNTPKALAINS